jgi:hypothetical protein
MPCPQGFDFYLVPSECSDKMSHLCHTVGEKMLYRAKTLYHDTFPINFEHLKLTLQPDFLYVKDWLLKIYILIKFFYFFLFFKHKKVHLQNFAVFPTTFQRRH